VIRLKEHMNIIFVSGIMHGGKSHYIKQELSQYPVYDLWDYQENCESRMDVYRSYVQLSNALRIKCVLAKPDDTIVVEHTLAKAKRRLWYLKRLPKNAHKQIRWVNPSKEEFIKIWVRDATHHNKHLSPRWVSQMWDAWQEQAEPPDLDEGWDSIIEVSPIIDYDAELLHKQWIR